MSLEIDLFWSFRSPYSYLATPRLKAMSERYDLAVHTRPVLPIAVRIDGFFDRINPMWPPYLMRDTQRIAEYEGIPYGWPFPDPIVQTLGDDGRLKTADEQPYIFRLTRLGVEAERRGRALPFLYEVSTEIFGGVAGWNEGDRLARAAERAGLDLTSMDAAVSADPAGYDAEIERNQAALEAAGHWGVPTMVFHGEPFFGQDRIDLLLWRLGQHGLTER